jgi:hypothetical protein
MVTVLSMLYAPVSGLFSRIGKLIAWPFFFVAYAIPILLYGIALAGIFQPDAVNSVSYGLLGLSRVVPPPDLGMNIGIGILATVLVLLEAVGGGWFGAVAIGALAASHLVAFFRHYGVRGELRDSGAWARSVKPLGWLFLMHGIVVAGGSAALSGDSPVWAPLLIIAVKTGVDLYAHFSQWSRLPPPLLSAPDRSAPHDLPNPPLRGPG